MSRKGLVTTNPLYWMPVNVAEWLVQIAGGLTTEQYGAASLLIHTSWQQNPPCTLPADDATLAGITRLGARWPRNRDAVLNACRFYPGHGGRLVADWLRRLYDEQIEKFNHRSAANAANRAKRDQHELSLEDGTNGSTNRGTNRTTNRVQKLEVREVREETAVTARDALAPSGARVAGVAGPVRITDILRGIPGVDPAMAPKVPVS